MLPLTNSPAEAIALAGWYKSLAAALTPTVPAPAPAPWVPLPTDPDRPGSDAPESYWPR